MNVEEAVKYFGDCKPKYLKSFSEKTPQGNLIEGYICKKSNHYLGSLLITRLNGEPHEQFVQSMPHIGYFEDDRDMVIRTETGKLHDAIAFEKMDGSCLILYPILEGDKIVEVVPKTRGRAVADSHFLDLFDKTDKSAIWKYYATNKGILIFEMYGVLNQHEIIHYETGIDLVLIGHFKEGLFWRAMSLRNMAKKYGFRTPDWVFDIRWSRRFEQYIVQIPSKKYEWYFDEVKTEDKLAPTLVDAIATVQKFLDFLNKTYMDMYGRVATEGVVINCTDSKRRQRWLKVKPRDIERKHRGVDGVSRSSIVKEVMKYFDDYGSEVEEIYRNDPNHHTEYITRMLLEDYSEEYVMKSAKKIEKVFMQVWDAKQVPQSLHNIAQELYDEYKGQGITHCMRMFGQKYPMKKKDAKTIYQVLEIKFRRNE